MTPLALSRQTDVLEDLLGEVAALSRAGGAPLVVFDLDDTLLSTAQRHVRILREFASQPKVRALYPDEAWLLAQMEPSQVRYLIAETAREAGVDDAGLLEELKAFWFARFFTNEYLAVDEEIPGAADYCQEVEARGGRPVYMTGRDEGMRSGTLEALSRRGFPPPDGEKAFLILKPRFETPDLEFKTEALRRLGGMGRVAGGFENEPAHVNLLREAFPDSRMVFVDTRHSGKPVRPLPQIPWIKDFRRG